MKCDVCQDTGQVILFTSIEDCTSCKLATISRYIINDLREHYEENHWTEFYPLVLAVENKTSIACRLLVCNPLYDIKIGQELLEIIPYDKTCWGYLLPIPSESLYLTEAGSTIIDYDDYTILEITHKDDADD